MKVEFFDVSKDTFLTIFLHPKAFNLPTSVIRISSPKTPNYLKPIDSKTLALKDLKINNSTIITPALNRVPGVYMHSGALNTNRITIRGIGNRSPFITSKIKAFVDDIPLTNGSGETTIEDIDLNILGKVDVLKGPTSSIYGAGLGGMLYLKTPEIDQQKTEFALDNTIGSFGLVRNVLSFKNATETGNQINVVLNNTRSDGYRENNRYNRTGLGVYGKLKLNEKESFSIFGNYIFLNAQIPSSLDSTDFANNPQKAADTWAAIEGYETYRKNIIGGTYRSSIGKYFSQSSTLYSTFGNSYEKRPFNILREFTFTVGARTEWAYTKFFSKSNNQFELRTGAEWFYERYSWLTYTTDWEFRV